MGTYLALRMAALAEHFAGRTRASDLLERLAEAGFRNVRASNDVFEVGAAFDDALRLTRPG